MLHKACVSHALSRSSAIKCFDSSNASEIYDKIRNFQILHRTINRENIGDSAPGR